MTATAESSNCGRPARPIIWRTSETCLITLQVQKLNKRIIKQENVSFERQCKTRLTSDREIDILVCLAVKVLGTLDDNQMGRHVDSPRESSSGNKDLNLLVQIELKNQYKKTRREILLLETQETIKAKKSHPNQNEDKPARRRLSHWATGQRGAFRYQTVEWV